MLFETIKINAVPDTRRIRRSEIFTGGEKEISLCGIRGETVSAQIILTSLRDFTVAEYRVKMSDLVTEEGDAIPSSAAEFFNEKYIKIWNPSFEKTAERTSPLCADEYPDALIPMESALAARENILFPGLNQGIWISLALPENAKKGVYKGKVTISIGEENAEVPVTVRVFGVQMPKELHARSLYEIWYYLIGLGENGKDDLALEEKYYEYLVQRRINPTSVPVKGYKNYTEFADYLVRFAKDERVCDYRLPSVVKQEGERLYVDSDEAKAVLCALAEKQKSLRAAGDMTTDLFAKGFWYTIDEPDYGDHMADVPAAEKALIRAKEETAALYPEFAESILKVRHVMVTQFLHPECAGSDAAGGIQTWCVQVHRLASDQKYAADGKEMSAREFIGWRRKNPDNKAAGEDIWFYHCNQPENPFPTDMIDDNLIALRLLTWMQFSLDVSGILSWCVNYYQKYSEIGVTPRNVWEDPVTMGRSNGDGFLLYPGARYGIDGPIGSIRLEAVRASKQDYECFYLLGELLKDYGADRKKRYDARKIVSALLSPLVHKDVIPVIDGKESEVFARNREKLLSLLEALAEKDGRAADLLKKID